MKDINLFETRRQTLFNGKFVDAVFATKDCIWPVFYAVFDRSKLHKDFRNGCFEVKNRSKFYFFSLNMVTLQANPWTSGMIYFLPSNTFERASSGLVSFDEWISNEPVIPLAKLEVTPQDFYFLDKVACHDSNESIIKSWCLYKKRTKQNNQHTKRE